MSRCEHEWHVEAEISLFEDKAPLGQLELTAACTKCPAVLEFLGMECGINLNGPAVSPDNREVRLAVSITTAAASLRHTGGRVVLDA